MFGSVIAAGADQTTGTVDLDQSTVLIKVRVASPSTSAIVKFNNVAVKFANTSDYTDVPGNYDTFEVTSGKIDWVAFG